MNLQQRIRNWLGITEILIQQDSLRMKADKAQSVLNAIGLGLGRVIAKLDAKFAESELSPERRAESDRIAEETIKCLYAEAAAREPYNHE